MLDAAEEIDLVRLACLGQNLLGLVALGRREDRIGLCRVSGQCPCNPSLSTQLTGRGDGQRGLDRLQLIRLDEAGVCHVGGIERARLQRPDGVLRLGKTRNKLALTQTICKDPLTPKQ